jgi:hypothetical protein
VLKVLRLLARGLCIAELAAELTVTGAAVSEECDRVRDELVSQPAARGNYTKKAACPRQDPSHADPDRRAKPG